MNLKTRTILNHNIIHLLKKKKYLRKEMNILRFVFRMSDHKRP